MTIITNSYMQYVEKGLNNYVHHAMTGQRKYINEFFSLKCAADLMQLGVFPDAKEITETLAAYRAIRKYFRKLDTFDESIVVHVVADGSTPRTGAFLAFLTKWKIYSIDPQMKENWLSNHGVNNLTCYADTIENTIDSIPKSHIVILVHPHVPYAIIKKLYEGIPFIAIPCCLPYPLDECDLAYRDVGIWSPMNSMQIYNKNIVR